MIKIYQRLTKAILFSLFLVLGFACSKPDEIATNYEYYLNAYINNVKYSTSSVATFVQANQSGCIASKSYSLTNIGQINVDSYFLDVYLKHYSKNTDFSTTKPSAHKIFDGGQLLSASSCNCDLIIGLIDNNIPSLYNNTILQSTNVVNNITAITLKDSTVSTYTYLVTGNFSCTFKNTNSVNIPVVGNFAVPIKVAKL